MNLPFFKFKHISDESRAGFRLKRILYFGVSLLGMRIVTLLVSIVSLPLTLNYLGKERFGLMEIVVTLVSLLSFSDLGLGFGLQNRLPDLDKDKNSNLLNQALSTVFFTLVLISLLFATIFSIVYTHTDWDKLFGLKSSLAQSEAGLTVFVFFICFIIQVPLSVVNKIQIGFQEGHLNSMWRAGGNIFGLVALIYVVRAGYGVPAIVAAIYGSHALFLLLNFCNQFLRKRKYLFPRIKFIKGSMIQYLYKDGVVFFVLQLATLILASSDRLIIANQLGIEEVAVFSVGFRLMKIFTSPMDAFINPLLPAFNDAIAEGDYNWVKIIFYKVLKTISILSILFAIGVVAIGNPILAVWVGDTVILPYAFLMAIGFYIFYSNWNSAISYIMLTPLFIRKFIKFYIVAVVVSLVLKFYLCSQFGLSGVLIGTIIGMTLFFFVPSFNILRKSKLFV